MQSIQDVELVANFVKITVITNPLTIIKSGKTNIMGFTCSTIIRNVADFFKKVQIIIMANLLVVSSCLQISQKQAAYPEDSTQSKTNVLSLGNGAEHLESDTTQYPTPELPSVEIDFPFDPLIEQMVFMQGGLFLMGCTTEQGYECTREEKPVHLVRLSNFYISKYEVSVIQFKQFVQESGYKTDAEKGDGSYIWLGHVWDKLKEIHWRHDVKGVLRPEVDYSHPVIHVSWNDAVAFCKWLSNKTGKTYRLPTEAEWEFAARGGFLADSANLTMYSGGNFINEVGWFSGNSNGETQAVGQKKPNQAGLYDMSGNVLEWCSNWFGPYSSNDKINPQGQVIGSLKVLRGGSWHNLANHCRTTYRLGYAPTSRNYLIGFRVVMDHKSTK